MAKFEKQRTDLINEDNSSLDNSSSENEYSSMNESNPLDYNAMTFEEKFDLAQSLNGGFNGAQHKRLNVAFNSYLMREIDQRTTLNIINEEIGELVHLKITDVSKVSHIAPDLSSIDADANNSLSMSPLISSRFMTTSGHSFKFDSLTFSRILPWNLIKW